MKLAQHFSAGSRQLFLDPVPWGRLNPSPSASQSSLRDLHDLRPERPSTEVLGYSRVSLRYTGIPDGVARMHGGGPALDTRAGPLMIRRLHV